MTISKTKSLSSDPAETGPIAEDSLVYFRARFRNRMYDYVVAQFLERERAGTLTRAELARRIGRKPEIVTRLLGAPGNWTLDTISDLMLGIAAAEPEIRAQTLRGRPPRNDRGRAFGSHVRPKKTGYGGKTPIALAASVGTTDR